jgi:hypothetical protein
MKSILMALAMVIIVLSCTSCSKEKVHFDKMPDSGNVFYKCPATPN